MGIVRFALYQELTLSLTGLPTFKLLQKLRALWGRLLDATSKLEFDIISLFAAKRFSPMALEYEFKALEKAERLANVVKVALNEEYFLSMNDVFTRDMDIGKLRVRHMKKQRPNSFAVMISGDIGERTDMHVLGLTQDILCEGCPSVELVLDLD